MPVSTRSRLSPAAMTFVILTVAACGMASLLALLPAAGHDQMWLLYAARLHLNGAPLYGPQIFETNPPVVIWLSMVPAWLAQVIGIPDTALGKLFMVLLVIAVGAVCLRLLHKVRPRLSMDALWALAFAFVTIFAVMPARDFGQRDDLLILFLLPYVFAAAVRAEELPLSPVQGVAIGAVALAGLALKPHQLLVVVGVESALLWVRRKRSGRFSLRTLGRPEILSMFVCGLLFLAAVHHAAPFYYSIILPLARDTYWAYGHRTLPQLVGDSIQLHVLLLIDLGLFFVARRSSRQTNSLITILLVAGIAATVAFYLQSTGWYYQQLPALSLLAMALVFLLLDFSERLMLEVPRWSPWAAGALGILALGLTTHFMDYPFTADRSFPLDTPDPAFFAGLPPGTPVMTISPTVDYTIQPIYKFHLTLGERYPALLMLPALLRFEDPQGSKIPRHITPERLAELDHIQRQDMQEDLGRWQPQLILVQRCQDPTVHCQVLEDRHDNLLAWFLRDPAFANAWSHYRYIGSRGEFDGYVLQATGGRAAR